MKMIQDLLTECGYSEQQAFSFIYQGEKLKWEHSVLPFVSNAGSREGYLLVSVGGRELPNLLKSDFLSEITCELGHQEFYSTDMDRNITLLLLCKREKGEWIDHDAKVRIEDDPYYFKKYVFVYTEQEETAALAHAGAQVGELSAIIREYLIDTKWFAGYKDCATADRKKETAEKKPTKGKKKTVEEVGAESGEKGQAYLAYKFFVELATKVTVMPIHPRGKVEIQLMEDYWQEERQKTPMVNLTAVECILEMDADNLDEVLEKWSDLNWIDVE